MTGSTTAAGWVSSPPSIHLLAVEMVSDEFPDLVLEVGVLNDPSLYL